MEATKADFCAEEIDGRTYWMPKTIKEGANPKKSVLLLPAFDEYIIAYTDRTAVLPAKNLSKAVSSNGIFRPVIVANGQVIGLWKKSPSKKQAVVVDYFEGGALSRAEEAVEDYKSFVINGEK
jgi:hypothetical protein